MQNSEYWKKRMEILEESQMNKGERYLKDLDDQYRKASSKIEGEISKWYNRFAANNNITMAEAKKLLNTKELKEFKWDVNDYIKYGKENAMNPIWMKELENASARVHISRLESLRLQMQQQVEVLYGNQTDDIDDLMRTIYQEGYYHTAYDIQKGFNVGYDLQAINKSQLDRIISKPWTLDGKTFSDRLWTNKQQLVGNLQTYFTQSVITGRSPDEIIKTISAKLKTDKKKAGRLVMTESAAFASASQKGAFNALDVERFEIVATLDNHTSEICQDLDGHVFDMKDFEVGATAPPFHVWCRSTTVPYFDDEFSLGERAARGEDGKTYYIPSDMKYPEWKKTFVDGGSKADLGVIMKSKSINDLTTVAEVEEFMKSKQWFKVSTLANGNIHNSNDYIKLDGIDIEAAKQIYIAHEEVFDKYPQMVGKLSAINAAKLSSSVYANCSIGLGTGGITVNTRYYSDAVKLAKEYADDVKLRFHPVGTDWTSAVTHELGHAIDDYLSNTLKVAGMQPNGWAVKYVSADLRPKVMKAVGLKVNETLKNLSGYATKNAFEWFAEAFAEYMKSETPRPIAVELGRRLDEIMKGVE